MSSRILGVLLSPLSVWFIKKEKEQESWCVFLSVSSAIQKMMYLILMDLYICHFQNFRISTQSCRETEACRTAAA